MTVGRIIGVDNTITEHRNDFLGSYNCAQFNIRILPCSTLVSGVVGRGHLFVFMRPTAGLTIITNQQQKETGQSLCGAMDWGTAAWPHTHTHISDTRILLTGGRYGGGGALFMMCARARGCSLALDDFCGARGRSATVDLPVIKLLSAILARPVKGAAR